MTPYPSRPDSAKPMWRIACVMVVGSFFSIALMIYLFQRQHTLSVNAIGTWVDPPTHIAKVTLDDKYLENFISRTSFNAHIGTPSIGPYKVSAMIRDILPSTGKIIIEFKDVPEILEVVSPFDVSIDIHRGSVFNYLFFGDLKKTGRL